MNWGSNCRRSLHPSQTSGFRAIEHQRKLCAAAKVQAAEGLLCKSTEFLDHRGRPVRSIDGGIRRTLGVGLPVNRQADGVLEIEHAGGDVSRSACDWHLDPVGIDTLESFVKSEGLAATQVEPLSLEFYLRYAHWFQRRKGIEPFPVYVRRLDYSTRTERFHALNEDDSIISAKNVVIAVGFKYFKHLPIEIAEGVPAGRLSHTCDLVNFELLRDKRCLIIGGRQSAFEWVALISEAGADEVHICHRHGSPAFKTADWSWVGHDHGGPGLVGRLPPGRQQEMHRRL